MLYTSRTLAVLNELPVRLSEFFLLLAVYVFPDVHQRNDWSCEVSQLVLVTYDENSNDVEVIVGFRVLSALWCYCTQC